jgi:cyclic pyranopterin phosphate synthase
MTTLSHIGPGGRARMVGVTAKADTDRRARATGAVRMQPETLHAIIGDTVHKGDVVAVARIAGIQAAKRTAELIPLCHSIPLTDIQVNVAPDESLPGLRVEAVVRSVGKTGVEMEALTAVAVTLLTVYDMAKSIDRSMVLLDVRLDEKSGGKGGDWSRE